MWWLVLAACLSPVQAPEASSPRATKAQEEAPNAAHAPTRKAPTHRGPVVCGLDPYVAAPDADALERLGDRLGLETPRAFASVVQTVRTTGDLPACYATKREAARAGWSRGERLWEDLPGGAIGGDTFHNREGLLPRVQGRHRYVEADLDQDDGRRGAHRLVFVDGARGAKARIWVTVDHYDSFVPVPAAQE